MAQLTPEDMLAIQQRVEQRLTRSINPQSGSELLADAIIRIAVNAAVHVVLEYHQALTQKGESGQQPAAG